MRTAEVRVRVEMEMETTFFTSSRCRSIDHGSHKAAANQLTMFLVQVSFSLQCELLSQPALQVSSDLTAAIMKWSRFRI